MDTEAALRLRWVLLPFAGVFGAVIGSFLNAFIYRWPLRISMWRRSRSFCPLCKHDLAWYDNVPIVSYLMLLGRCRYCKGRIHPRYIAVELITTLLFLLIYYQEAILNFGRLGPAKMPVFNWGTIAIHLAFAAALIGASFIDCLVMRLPNEITLGGMIAAPVLSVAVPALHPTAPEISGIVRIDALFSCFFGMLAGGATLWVIGVAAEAVLKKPAMGFGDVKLMAFVGGILGWDRALLAIALGAVIGAVIGGVNLALTGKHKVPFGPFLVAGAIASMIWGPALVAWYFSLLRDYPMTMPYRVPLPW